jgi:hypothetical protein
VYRFLSGSSPLTCPAWETLPAATLPPAKPSGSYDHARPAITSKYGYLWGEFHDHNLQVSCKAWICKPFIHVRPHQLKTYILQEAASCNIVLPQ